MIEVNETYVKEVVGELGTDNFGVIQTHIRKQLDNRSLTYQEKGCIESVLHTIRMKDADEQRLGDALFEVVHGPAAAVLMVTAYSDDYSIGGLCEQVNRLYASKYNFHFHSDVCSLDAITAQIAPKKHCTWYKIAVLRKLFADTELLRSKNIQYVMWIDADAIAVDHSISLESIISQAGGRDLIIAEDMNTGCLVNAGVFMLRTTHWSRRFLDEVWACDKYDEVCFYEQSAMMRCLRAQKEGLDTVRPFHSYLPDAPSGPKLFPHTAVLPIFQFNSNRGILCNDVVAFQEYAARVLESEGSVPQKQTSRSDTSLTDVLDAAPSGATASSSDPMPTNAAVATKNTPVPCLCYRRDGNYCPLCQRTAGSQWKKNKAAAARAVSSASLFIFHPAGMPDKLLMLHAAIYKFRLSYDLTRDILHMHDGDQSGSEQHGESSEGGIGSPGGRTVPAPLRLVRGRMGQIPQEGQTHLLHRLGKST
jgi:hypothetical protein